MSFILAVLSAGLYGIADFAGGFATRRDSVFPVIGLSQITGALLALAAVPLLGGGSPSVSDLLLGGGAGIFGSMGLFFLYKGLAETSAAVVSPTSAIVGALVPVSMGLVLGEVPSLPVCVGCAVCLPAIVLLTWERRDPDAGPGETTAGEGARSAAGVTVRSHARRALFLGILSGIGFGIFFVFVSRTNADAGIWPLISARAASVAVILAIAGIRRERIILPPSRIPLVILTGLFDMGANIAFLLAVRSGMLILVSVVTGLYPAPTVLLARVILKQRMGVLRIVGFAFALLGMVFISMG